EDAGGDVWLIEEKERPGEHMPIEEDEHGTYIMNSKDLRAIEHVQKLVAMGIDSLKIEGRTKSPYYAARTCQAYRQAIDDAVAGRALDPALLAQLDGLANRGYTDGFYQRHHDAEYQNYLRGHSESARSLYVGDVVAYDAARGLAEIDVKNRFAVGDRIELVHPAGNSELALERMEKADGTAITVAPGNGHRVWVPLPETSVGAYVARFV
ncbi:MAG: U32 family peptidase C-terminal domain-containing protein, partial [Rhodocyclaceae bacterium]